MHSTSAGLAGAAAFLLLAWPAAPAAAQPPARERLVQTVERRAALRAGSRYDDTFRKYSKRYFGPNFDWRHIKAQAMAESDLNPNARSRVGARGLMQLMPSTYGLIRSRRPEFGEINDPEWNIAAGVMHDRYLYKLWPASFADDERLRFTFGAYNAGEGTIARAATAARERRLEDGRWTNIEQIAPTVTRWRYRETLGYVRRIDSNYTELRKDRDR